MAEPCVKCGHLMTDAEAFDAFALDLPPCHEQCREEVSNFIKAWHAHKHPNDYSWPESWHGGYFWSTKEDSWLPDSARQGESDWNPVAPESSEQTSDGSYGAEDE